MKRRLLLAVAVFAILVISCGDGNDVTEDTSTTEASVETTIGSSDADGDEATETAAQTTTAPAPPVAVALDSWEAAELPPPTSSLEGCGDLIVYESLEVGSTDLKLVAVDATTGALAYEIGVDRGSILPGEWGEVTVDCASNQLFGLDDAGLINGYDLQTGELRWTAVDPITRAGVCDTLLCGPVPGRNAYRFLDINTGQRGDIISLEDSRVLSREGGFSLFPVGDTLETGPAAFFGYQLSSRIWRIPAIDIREQAGHAFTPSTGWWTVETATPGAIVQYLGPVVDESAGPSERVTAGGVVFSFDIETGDLHWVRGNMVGCMYPESIFCVFGGYSDGTYDIFEIERINTETGVTLWTHPVDGYPNLTLVGDAVQVVFFTDGEQTDEYWVDYETGERIAEPELAFLACSSYDAYTEDSELRLRAPSRVTGSEAEWTIAEFAFPCHADGEVVSDPDLLVSQLDLLDDLAHVTDAGWRVYYDGQRLHGVQAEP